MLIKVECRLNRTIYVTTSDRIQQTVFINSYIQQVLIKNALVPGIVLETEDLVM